MSEQVIKLSQNAAERIKDIMSKAEEATIGVREASNLGDVQACLILWSMLKI